MSQKPEATYHGADIVDRLDVIAPHSEDGRLLQEAAHTVRYLRAKLEAHEAIPQAEVVHLEAHDETVERVARAIHAEYRKTDPGIHRGGWDEIAPGARDQWMTEARAALSALHEATR